MMSSSNLIRSAFVRPSSFNPFNISTAALISISSEKVAIPATVKSLPIFKFFPIPIPPATIIAPEVVDDDVDTDVYDE